MDENEQAVICWVNTFELDTSCQSLSDLYDGVLLAKVCNAICPEAFDVTTLNASTGSNYVLAALNFKKLIRMLNDYYRNYLFKVIDMSTIDVNAIATEHDFDEMLALVEVVIAAALLCENKGIFIQRIFALDHISQAVLKALVQRVMERVSDVAEDDQEATDVLESAETGSAEYSSRSGTKQDVLSSDISEEHVRSQELIRHLQEERQRLLSTINDLELRTQVLTAAKEKLESTLSGQNDRNGRPSQADEEHHSATLTATAAATASAQQALKDEIEDLKRDLDVQLVENESMRGTLKAFTQKYEASREIQAKLEMENQQLADELDVTRDKATKLVKAEAVIDKYQKKVEELIPLKKQNAEYLDKMDKYVDQIYELESANKSLSRMVDQYRDKNVELEREKYEAQSAQQMQAFEVSRLSSELDAAMDGRRFLEEELSNAREEIQSLSEAHTLDAVNTSFPGSSDAFETESVASLREKIKKLEFELRTASASTTTIGAQSSSTHSSSSTAAIDSTELAAIRADLENALRLRKEREEELVAAKKQIIELTAELKKSNRALVEIESSAASKSNVKETEQKLAVVQNTVRLLEEKLKERETANSKLEQEKSKLEAYAKKALSSFKEKYLTLLQSIKLENKSLKAQLSQATSRQEQDAETSRREERLLLSTMYEIGVRLMDRNIQEKLEPAQQTAATTLLAAQRSASAGFN